MKRLLALILAVLLIVAMMAACGKKDKEEEKTTATDPEDIANANYVNLDAGFTDVTVTDGDSAIRAVASVSDSLGVSDPASQLRVTSTAKYDGETYYRMQQYFDGAPVYGREVVLVADQNGKALSLSSNLVKTNADVPEKKDPSGIDYKKLFEKATALLKNDKLEFLDFKCVAKPEMIYYSADGASLRSCFENTISFKDTNKKEYFVNILFDCDTYEPVSVDFPYHTIGRSVTGSGMDRDNVLRQFTAYTENNNYYMLDADRLIAVFDAKNETVVPFPVIVDDQQNTYFYDNGELYAVVDGELYEFKEDHKVYLSDDGTQIVDANGKVVGTDLKYQYQLYSDPNDAIDLSQSSSSTWTEPNAVSAISRVKNADDFYRNVLGRNSYNDNGGTLYICYNDYNDGDTTNAYSAGSQKDMTVLSFGSDNNIPFDVVGHEFTHSVLGSIVDLPYRNQTGALNEAYADIFGEIIEDYSDGTLDNSCDWKLDTFRDLTDPESNGYPTRYRGTNWVINLSVPESLANTPLWILNDFTDNGGVHKNSTIISHAAYLMNIGIDGDTTKKIDTELLAKIFYRSMFSFHSDETFQQCAQDVYNAASRTPGVTPAQLDCVKEAFSLAGLAVQ